MSRFRHSRLQNLTPYTPGEQVKGSVIKLNTNESPYPPVLTPEDFQETMAELHRYPDPEALGLKKALAHHFAVKPSMVAVGNGSDELLHFAFMAYGDAREPISFPDITYGFYPVFAKLHGIAYEEVPLRQDFRLALEDYEGEGPVLIANPNAPTGLALSADSIRQFLDDNPRRLLIVDEAYGDFGAESVIPLTHEYANLLVIRTFSKGYGFAGGRLGVAVASLTLIDDLRAIQYSVNPYNVNALTQKAGELMLARQDEYEARWQELMKLRRRCQQELEKKGMTVLDSKANFLFAKKEGVPGRELYEALKAQGIYVRHFDQPRIKDYIRITIGTANDMEALLNALPF